MKSEWKEYSLGELYEVHNGLSKGRKFFGRGYPFLSFSTVFNRYFLPEKLTDLVESTEKERETLSIRRGDIFITRTSETYDELGMSCVALKNYPNATFNGFTKRLRPHEEGRVLPEFIGYFLRGPQFRRKFEQIANVTTRASLSNGDLLNMVVSLPPLPVQRKIASILSALDDKIETNNAICRNLEEQARALYELWLSKRKNECEWLSLEAIADLNPEAYSIKEKWGYINYLDTGNITDGVISSIQKIDLEQDELPSRARRKVKAGDVVFSTVRPNQRHFGILHSPLPNMLVSTGFTVIRSNKTDISNELIYLLLSDSSFVEKMQQIGEQSVSAYPSVKPTDIATCQIPFMDSMDYFQMQKVICAMFSQSAVLKDVNRYLSDMRDTLLPKLMNGEIDLGKLGKLA